MKFQSDNVAFGRHETFALRYAWLPKGFQAVINDCGVFESENATVSLGVGKNMVTAIRYWLQACQMIEKVNSVWAPTEIGTAILDPKKGFDPYLEDEATIWLIHWLLASNSTVATSWYWFFNKFHRPEFTGSELQSALSDFTKESVLNSKRPKKTTTDKDALLIPRMYTQSKGNGRTPLEEALDSPLSSLRLMTQSAGGRSYQSRPEARPALPIGILGYAVSKLIGEKGSKSIPIEDLMYSRDEYPALGSIFRLTEMDLLAKLEKLVSYIPDVFAINETAGIHQLYKLSDHINPMIYIERTYADSDKGVAA